jgi:hypothetical protein
MKAIKTIYLAGSITNNPMYKIDFKHAEAQVRNLFPEAEIFNPVTLCEKEGITDWDECMAYTHLFLKQADTIALIGGWSESKGARLELSYALANEKTIIELASGQFRQIIGEIKTMLENICDIAG